MVFAFIFHPCPANKPAKRLAQTQINVIRSISALRYVQKLFTPPCSVVRPSRRASAASERAAERDSTVNDAAKRRSPLLSLGPTDTAEPNARTPEWDCWGGKVGRRSFVTIVAATVGGCFNMLRSRPPTLL